LNVVTNTFGVFEKPKADRFVIEQDGNTGYLLGEESINDICVDGGNRKWFATNNGVFAVEPNGQEVLANYRADNSPLPDDKIYCIGQIGASGELFFGTEAGICSYRNDASESEDVFSAIKIYPNPVKPGYTGLVTVEGLATDAEVRITDATGVMVYKTKANGGTATWPCTRLDGTRPNSGVYYVFGVNADGTETAMGKFVFIR
jgi:ligand-binding sensor domain-containing protein